MTLSQNIYEIIKELAEHRGNKARAALKLQCSRRTADRHIAGCKREERHISRMPTEGGSQPGQSHKSAKTALCVRDFVCALFSHVQHIALKLFMRLPWQPAHATPK
jgi:hypothetical protein